KAPCHQSRRPWPSQPRQHAPGKRTLTTVAVSVSPAPAFLHWAAHWAAVADRGLVRRALCSLAAKLTRWGIDAHMGILFGWPNQLLVAAVALGLCGMVISGYWMWWRRRPSRTQSTHLLADELKRTPWAVLIPLVLTAVLVGWFLPVLGASLLAFLLVDLLRSSLKR